MQWRRSRCWQPYQKRSPLMTNGTSHGFALSFAFLSAASHRRRLHSSATMVFATLNLPCIGQSKPVASPVRSSSCAGDLQIGQGRGLGNGLLRRRRTNFVYLGTTTFWKNSRASITASVPNQWLKPCRFRPTSLCLVLCAVESVAHGVQMTRVARTSKAPIACTVARSVNLLPVAVLGAGASSASPRDHCDARI